MLHITELKQRGMTLVELLIAMTIGLIMTAAISTSFLIQYDAYEAQNQLVEVIQATRIAMDMMSREIRMAGYNPKGATFNFDGITYDTNQLKIQADLDGNGKISGNEEITYRYNADKCQIQRRTYAGSFQPFAENIEAFIYHLADESGKAATVSNDIRQVSLVITIKSQEKTRNYGHQIFTLKNAVKPRNLEYPGELGFGISTPS